MSNTLSHHDSSPDLAPLLVAKNNAIEQRTDLTLEEKAELQFLLRELSNFEMGKFLLQNHGFNGYWTHQMVYEHPKQAKAKGKPYFDTLNQLERDFLTSFPTILATQERFTVFQRLLKNSIRPHSRVCSLPCGLMAELLTLDPSVHESNIVGVDIDAKSLEHAQNLATQNGYKNIKFLEHDAWVFEDFDKFDVLVSNGLNIYVESLEQEKILYRNFFNLLKPGGMLITSFLTYPAVFPQSEWDLPKINATALRLQKLVFSDLLGAKWQNYHTSKEMFEIFHEVGLEGIEIHWDRQRIFPTISARRPE